ncbi:KICSTOR complex protein szt2, partial [Rhizophlyctis rosea]
MTTGPPARTGTPGGDGYNSSSSTGSRPSRVQMEEATAVALYIRDSYMFTRSEHDQWILRNVFRPISDLGASMSVIDSSGRAKDLTSIAFETICKCLDGLCRPFSIEKTHGGSHDIYPELHITIFADIGTTYFRSGQYPRASHFAKRHPMRVLIQDVLLTRDNLMAVAERLYDAINAFEHDFVVQREKDTEASATIAYLPGGLFGGEGTESPASGDTAQGEGEGDGDEGKIVEEGVFRLLEEALFCLDQLPKDAVPVLILVTDGVITDASTSLPISQRTLWKITKQNVIFTALQTGSGNGFTPSVNYGHVPDNEFLRWLAVATEGKVVYSSDCRYLEADANQPVPREALPPNFYHVQFLFRERAYGKVTTDGMYRAVHDAGGERRVDVTRVRRINRKGQVENADYDDDGVSGGGNGELEGEVRYPWEPTSRTPFLAEIVCGYREYYLGCPLSLVVEGRLCEGYTLKSILLTERKERGRPDKVELVFGLAWIPNVTVCYTVRGNWIDRGKSVLEGGVVGSVGGKGVKVDLGVVADHAFAAAFVN